MDFYKDTILIFVGLFVVAWRLDGIFKPLMTIHFMMKDEFDRKHGLRD